jgi:hypothetical protein
MNYYDKYLLYKKKYLNLKNSEKKGGDSSSDFIENASDEDLVFVSDDFVKNLKEIYPSAKHDAKNLRNSYKDKIITYGEIEYDGIQNIFEHLHSINERKINNFVDIGSGRGKIPLYMAALSNILKSVGIELVKERHDDALEIKNQLNEFEEIINKVNIINLSDHIEGKTLVWLSNLCFPEELNNTIFRELINKLPQDSIISCSQKCSLVSSKLRLIETLQVPMSWNDRSTVYLYKIN